MSIINKETFKQSLPAGWINLTQTFPVSGVNRRIDAVNVALNTKDINQNIFIQPEPDNEHDENALMVIVKKNWFIFSTNFHIGYVPADIAEIVCNCNFEQDIKIRIVNFITYKSGLKAVICNLIGQSKYIGESIKYKLNDY